MIMNTMGSVLGINATSNIIMELNQKREKNGIQFHKNEHLPNFKDHLHLQSIESGRCYRLRI